jgi:hypothetical protein
VPVRREPRPLPRSPPGWARRPRCDHLPSGRLPRTWTPRGSPRLRAPRDCWVRAHQPRRSHRARRATRLSKAATSTPPRSLTSKASTDPSASLRTNTVSTILMIPLPTRRAGSISPVNRFPGKDRASRCLLLVGALSGRERRYGQCDASHWSACGHDSRSRAMDI